MSDNQHQENQNYEVTAQQREAVRQKYNSDSLKSENPSLKALMHMGIWGILLGAIIFWIGLCLDGSFALLSLGAGLISIGITSTIARLLANAIIVGLKR